MATLNLSITVPDAVQARLLAAFCRQHGYQATVGNPAFNPVIPENPTTNPRTIANPENRVQFLKRKVIDFIKESASAAEATADAEAARKAAADKAGTDFVLS